MNPLGQTGLNIVVTKARSLVDALPLLKDNCQLAGVIQKAEEAGLGNVTKPYLAGRAGKR